MPTITITDITEVLDALEQFIKQRPRLEYANYGDLTSYRAELRDIAQDRKRALTALREARQSTTHDAALLADSFRAFSGRLEWDGKRLDYTTGQYFPTEYRKAAASVLETYVRALKQQWAADHPQAFTFKTMADVRAANAAIGNSWFDPGSMRFFSTRIESKLLTRGSGNQYFITSEENSPHPRKYSIRQARPDGTIDTIGEFQQYESLEEAQQAIVALP